MYARPHRTGLGSHGLGLSYASVSALPPAGSLRAEFDADPLTKQFQDTFGWSPVKTSGDPIEPDVAFEKAKLDGFVNNRADFDFWSNSPMELRWAAGRKGEPYIAWMKWLDAWSRAWPAMSVLRNGIPPWKINNRPSPWSDITGTYPIHDALRNYAGGNVGQWRYNTPEIAAAIGAMPEGPVILAMMGMQPSGVPVPPVPTGSAVAPDPAYPVGVQLLSMGGVGADSADIPGDTGFPDAVDGIVGARLMTRMNNGQVAMGPWVPTTRVFGVRYLDIGASSPTQQTTGWYATRPANLEGVPTTPLSRAERIPYSVPAHVLADEAAILSFVKGLGAKVNAPAAWGGPLTTIYQPKPIPVPPPGSQVFVPTPDSGKEPSIKLPGSTEFVPISSVPPAVFNPANWPSGGSPPVVVNESGEPVGPVTPASGGLLAGLGGVNGFLILGAVVGLMLMNKRKS